MIISNTRFLELWDQKRVGTSVEERRKWYGLHGIEGMRGVDQDIGHIPFKHSATKTSFRCVVQGSDLLCARW